MKALSSDELDNLFKDFARHAFRLETLQEYAVPEEREAFRAFCNGASSASCYDPEWSDFVKSKISSGAIMQRIHIVDLPLTPYLEYEIECGYAFSSQAGEDIFLIDRKNLGAPEIELSDFWIFDHSVVVRMIYRQNGEFDHAQLVDEKDSSELKSHAAHLLQKATRFRDFQTARNQISA